MVKGIILKRNSMAASQSLLYYKILTAITNLGQEKKAFLELFFPSYLHLGLMPLYSPYPADALVFSVHPTLPQPCPLQFCVVTVWVIRSLSNLTIPFLISYRS